MRVFETEATLKKEQRSNLMEQNAWESRNMIQKEGNNREVESE